MVDVKEFLGNCWACCANLLHKSPSAGWDRYDRMQASRHGGEWWPTILRNAIVTRYFCCHPVCGSGCRRRTWPGSMAKSSWTSTCDRRFGSLAGLLVSSSQVFSRALSGWGAGDSWSRSTTCHTSSPLSPCAKSKCRPGRPAMLCSNSWKIPSRLTSATGLERNRADYWANSINSSSLMLCCDDITYLFWVWLLTI